MRLGHRPDQSAVWEGVARVAHLHDAASSTEALRDTREHLAGKLRVFEGLSGDLPADARGGVVTLGGRCVLAEVMAGPRSFGKVFSNLLSGYALEALEHGREEEAPDVSEAE